MTLLFLSTPSLSLGSPASPCRGWLQPPPAESVLPPRSIAAPPQLPALLLLQHPLRSHRSSMASTVSGRTPSLLGELVINPLIEPSGFNFFNCYSEGLGVFFFSVRFGGVL